MKAPFPWFGGKRKAADLIWSRFGDVVNYVEPFAGSLAVLLERPHWPFVETRVETVNDIDAYVVNFWRAIQADPEAVAVHADNPVFEVDIHARHQWLHSQAEHVERLKCEPDYYDARIAGYWCWGLSCWIGDNFCRPTRQNGLPHLGTPGMGVNRQLPHLGTPAWKSTFRAAARTDTLACLATSARLPTGSALCGCAVATGNGFWGRLQPTDRV